MILVIPIFIPHRGCPHDCLFCNQQKISGESGTGREPEEITEIIDTWLSHARKKSQVQVAFFGGSFTCLPKEEQLAYLDAVQPYIIAGKVDAIRLSTRPDCIDSKVVETLKKYAVKVVEIGVQSFNDTVLQRSLRGHTAAQSVSAFRLLKSAGMSVGLQLMVGLPGETTYSFFKGIEHVCRLNPDFIRLYPVLVVEGSGLEKQYADNSYSPHSLNKAVVIGARAYGILQAVDIKIIRMGLQPSDDLKDSVIAGPYHPAFGDLVQSRYWLKQLRAQCVLLKEDDSLVIYVSHRDISSVVGHKRNNVRRLGELGYSGRVHIKADRELPQGSVRYVIN